MNQRGFTLVELMVVLVVLGILANIAVPVYYNARNHAEAASILADFHVVKSAAFDCFSATNEFPRTAGWGRIPREMEGRLPREMDFVHGDATYKWTRTSLNARLSAMLPFQHLLVFQVRSSNPDVLESLKAYIPQISPSISPPRNVF
jgi:prepilin-type N-terminal cleavage/methylation domain-containing protein